MLNFNHCHLYVEIFTKRHKMQVANALSTADCKVKTNLVSGKQSTSVPRRRSRRRIKETCTFSRKSRDTEVLMKKDLCLKNTRCSSSRQECRNGSAEAAITNRAARLGLLRAHCRSSFLKGLASSLSA